MVAPRVLIGLVAGRGHQAQSRVACRLRRKGILPIGGRTPNLGTSRDERHLMLVFHDGITWSRIAIIP